MLFWTHDMCIHKSNVFGTVNLPPDQSDVIGISYQHSLSQMFGNNSCVSGVDQRSRVQRSFLNLQHNNDEFCCWVRATTFIFQINLLASSPRGYHHQIQHKVPSPKQIHHCSKGNQRLDIIQILQGTDVPFLKNEAPGLSSSTDMGTALQIPQVICNL